MRTEKADILLIEDNTDDAFLLTRELKKQHQSIAIAHVKDGAEALAYFFDNATTISALPVFKPKLVVLDLKMPKVNGIEVLARLKEDESTKDIPVVIFTSSDLPSDITNAYKMGANSYIVKPVDYDDFQATITDLSKYWISLNKYIG